VASVADAAILPAEPGGTFSAIFANLTDEEADRRGKRQIGLSEVGESLGYAWAAGRGFTGLGTTDGPSRLGERDGPAAKRTS
jgi:hypothetical protein